MHIFPHLTGLIVLAGFCAAEQWPYRRYQAQTDKKGNYVALKSQPEFKNAEPRSNFGHWFHQIVNHQNINNVQRLFVNKSIPDFASFDDIRANLRVPRPSVAANESTILPPHIPKLWPEKEALSLFGHLPFDLDIRCTSDRDRWYGPFSFIRQIG